MGRPPLKDANKRERNRHKPKIHNGVKVCAYGYCLAPLTDRRGIYCSDEHANLAKNAATMEARAHAVADAYLEAVALGEYEPPAHRGWLTVQQGVYLDGKTVLELRALTQQLAQARHDLREARLGRVKIDTGTALARLVEQSEDIEQALSKVLPPAKPSSASEKRQGSQVGSASRS